MKSLIKRFFRYRYLTSKTETYFKSKAGIPIPRYVVYCTDIPGLIAWKKLLEDENDKEFMNVIGLDDGKSILKICWNWSQSAIDEGKYKLMGPKRSIVLAYVCDVPETPHNITVLGTYVVLMKLTIYCFKILNFIILHRGNNHTQQNTYVPIVMATSMHQVKDG